MDAESSSRLNFDADKSEFDVTATQDSVESFIPRLDALAELPDPVPFEDSAEMTADIEAAVDAVELGSPDREVDPDVVAVADQMLHWYEETAEALGGTPSDRHITMSSNSIGSILNEPTDTNFVYTRRIGALIPLLNSSMEGVPDNSQFNLSLDFQMYYVATGDLYVQAVVYQHADSALLPRMPVDEFLTTERNAFVDTLTEVAKYTDRAVEIAKTTQLSFTEAAVSLYARDGVDDAAISRYLGSPEGSVYESRRRVLQREDDALDALRTARNTLSYLQDIRDDI